jgi:hypothetical protein
MSNNLQLQVLPEHRDLVDREATLIVEVENNNKLMDLHVRKDDIKQKLKICETSKDYEKQQANSPASKEQTKLADLEIKIKYLEKQKEEKEEYYFNKIESVSDLVYNPVADPTIESKIKLIEDSYKAKIKLLEEEMQLKISQVSQSIDLSKTKCVTKNERWVAQIKVEKQQVINKIEKELSELNNKKEMLEHAIDQKLEGTETKKAYILKQQLTEIDEEIKKCKQIERSIDIQNCLLRSKRETDESREREADAKKIEAINKIGEQNKNVDPFKNYYDKLVKN